MSISTVTTAAVCFIACHGGPADYFATFSKELGNEVGIYASGNPAYNKFKQKEVSIKESFNADTISPNELDRLAKKIAESYRKVVIDVAQANNTNLIDAIRRYDPDITICAFNDNPEIHVPGTWPIVAKKVMQAADKALFVNADHEHAKELSYLKDRVGIGCYSSKPAEAIEKRRKAEYTTLREKHGLEDKDQKVLVYFGGNNEDYFDKAFPAFLHFLSEAMNQADLSNTVIMMQQHPGAKDKNTDLNLIEKWKEKYGEMPSAPKIIISKASSDDMQIIADGILYYQTSMSPSFALAGIPIVQVGHEVYSDAVVKEGLCPSATTTLDFLDAIKGIQTGVKPILQEQKDKILKSVGFRENWLTNLKHALELK